MKTVYQYRVVIVKNNKLHRVIKNYRWITSAKNKFNKLKEERNVLFPRLFTNYQKIKKSNWELLLLKRKEVDGIGLRKIYNSSGKIITEKSIGDWNIINRTNYCPEETFYVYGLKKRLNVVDLLKIVFLPRITGFYHIVIVLNKIVILNDDDMEVILCKNLCDCSRLYDYMFDILQTQGIYDLLFLGKANKAARSKLYNRIQEHTGLTRKELYRTTTRS